MKHLRTAAIFSDGMVLQRETPVCVFGLCEGDQKITVILDDIAVTTSSREGEWKVLLPPKPAGGPYQMKVFTKDETIVYQDIYLGEVWLAGGQSNMEFELRNCSTGFEELNQTKDPLLRFYQVNRSSYIEEDFYKREEKNHWQNETQESFGTWSAVGYYFAKRLREELCVAVGIIGCNYGGTSASCWIGKEMLEKDLDTIAYLEDYEKVCNNRTYEEYLKQLSEYRDYESQWNKKVDNLYQNNPDILWSEVQKIAGPCRWPEPLGPHSPFRACGLYETMLKRVCPYTLRGFLYYQGESDDHREHTYAKLLRQLILQWRKDWENINLPFLFVQLPMHIGREDKDRGNWAVIREQQNEVYQTVRNTSMAVILDAGEFDDIHPRNKKIVGERLALHALAKIYQKNINPEAPSLQYAIRSGNEVTLFLKDSQGELYYKEDQVFKNSRERYVNKEKQEEISDSGFEIAGEDGIFYTATIRIEGNCIIVMSSEVDVPCYLRYAYHNFSPVTIYGGTNIPLSTFRITVL